MPIAFIVDGHLEKKVVQRLCPDAPVRMTNLNGKDVQVSAIVKRVASLVRLLRGRCFPVVVIVDRESRISSSRAMEGDIAAGLSDEGIDSTQLIVSVPDKMIENWIVAGVNEYNGKALNFTYVEGTLDGSNGKSVLKRELNNIDVVYQETTIGVDLFCSMNIEEASAKSPSFSRLASKLSPYCPSCRAVRA